MAKIEHAVASRRTIGATGRRAAARRVARVDLNDVDLFLRVVAAGSFTGAARESAMPKSAVSRRVARLEQALGARLLQRTTRSISLTEAGAHYHDEAARSLEGLAAARETVTSLQAEPRGLVRLSAPPDLPEPIAAILATFLRRHPCVTLDVDLSVRKVDLVAEGYDLAIRAGGVRDDRLVARAIFESTLVLVATPGYLKRKGTPRRAEDLALHDCILFHGQNGRARWPLDGPGGPIEVEVTGPVSANELRFVQRLVAEGIGIGLLPIESCGRDLAARRLARVLPELSGPRSALHLVWPPSRFVPLRVQLLRDHLLAELPKLPWPRLPVTPARSSGR